LLQAIKPDVDFLIAAAELALELDSQDRDWTGTSRDISANGQVWQNAPARHAGRAINEERNEKR
jgi:hypothetical protein